MERPLFNTLNYAKILTDAKVPNADIHAVALSKALSQGLYTKDEIDMRFEKALHRFELSQEKLRNEMREIELCFEKAANRNLIVTVSILGSLIVIANTISAFAHTLFH